MTSVLDSITKLQNTFKYCAVIIVGDISDEFWLTVQFKSAPGPATIIVIESPMLITNTMMSYMTSLYPVDKEKRERQIEFFRNVRIY